MSRRANFIAYKADWRGRRVVAVDPWFPSSQTCWMSGALHRAIRDLSMRTLRGDGGNVIDRDDNAAATGTCSAARRRNANICL
jgi:putative transposase